MLKTILWTACISALVCWAIGAYNRLVRLRFAAQNTSSVAAYNLAIKQFPASWLAVLFGFKPIIQSDDLTA